MCFGFCSECPKCIIHDEELYEGTNVSLFRFSVYDYQGRC